MSPRDIVLALVVVLVWGLNFIAIKWGVERMPPLLLGALRFTLAALPLVFFIKPPKVRLSLLVSYGLLAGALQFAALYVAIGIGMPAGLSSLIIQMQAFFTIALAMLFLGERPGWFQAGGAAVALLGIVAIASERLSGAAFLPLLLTLVSAAFWGGGNILTKRAGQIDMLAFIVWSSLIPPLPLLAVSLLTEGPAADWTALSQPSWILTGSILFSAYASTVIGYGLWSNLLARYPASTVAPFSLLVPVVGIAASALVLGEHLSPLEAIGSLVIFLGLMLNVFGARRARRARRAA